MANAKKCDICGQFYNFYQGVTLKNGKVQNGCKLRFESDSGTGWGTVDLCPECMTKVHNLLQGIMEGKDDD